MYAVVEFPKRECAIIPLIWTINDQTKCYWPRNATNKILKEYVVKKKVPCLTWSTYNIDKVLFITDNFEEAENYLQKAIEDSASSDSQEALNVLKRMEPSIEVGTKRQASVDSDSETYVETEELLRQTKLNKRNQLNETTTSKTRNDNDKESSSEFSTDEEENTSAPNNVNTPSKIPNTVSSPPIVNRPTTELIFKKIEQIIETQNQHSLLLNNMYRILETQAIATIQTPSSLPTMPASNKAEYRALDNFLQTKENYEYLRARLACIGGSSVRNAVMNMMKFVISNRVAIRFNWEGRTKKPFKETLLKNAIVEATRQAFSKKHPSEYDDKVIKSAIADWLKQAKSRYMYSLNVKK